MHISAIYIACQPETQAETTTQLEALDWVEVQLSDTAKIIVTIEVEGEKEAEQRIKELETVGGVVSVQVSAFYSE